MSYRIREILAGLSGLGIPLLELDFGPVSTTRDMKRRKGPAKHLESESALLRLASGKPLSPYPLDNLDRLSTCSTLVEGRV
jgi:hypothetical protein